VGSACEREENKVRKAIGVVAGGRSKGYRMAEGASWMIVGD